jgi:hypothetical protein
LIPTNSIWAIDPRNGNPAQQNLPGIRDMQASLRCALALVLMAIACGCSNKQPAAPSGVPTVTPTFTKQNDGMQHEFYKDTPLEEVMKTLESGSIDSLHLNTAEPKFVIVLATAKFPEGTKVKFNTTFTRSAGEPLGRPWEPADGNTSGTARALFMIDAAVTGAETKLQ